MKNQPGTMETHENRPGTIKMTTITTMTTMTTITTMTTETAIQIQIEIEIYNQILTWTAFAIIAMF